MERWVEEIEDWETRSVADGYRGLQSLASAGFSGAISADGTWLFMVNGRGVGVFEYRQHPGDVEIVRGNVEQFEEGDLTAYESPHSAIPMLVAMQTGETETRGRYYTEDTPISEVHDTLQEGGFTGYLELSENVLSGDYYIVYQGGRSMEVAFIGSSRRIETDDEAFDRAAGEVGIYEVVSVNLQPVDIPESEDEVGSAMGGASANVDAASDTRDTSDADRTETDRPEPATEDESFVAEQDASSSMTVDAADEASETSTTTSEGATATSETTSTEDVPDTDASREADGEATTSTDTAVDTDSASEFVDDENTESSSDVSGSSAPSPHTTSESTEPEPDTNQDTLTEKDTGVASSGDIVDREIPSLDPERSGVGNDGGTDRIADAGTDPGGDGGDRIDAGRDRATNLEDKLADREAELKEARATLKRVRADRDELRQRVSELESELEELHAALEASGHGATPEADTGSDTSQATSGRGGVAHGESLSPEQALARTNLFVRYRSKGKTTLEDVHDGADRNALADNLRLEHHTEFDDEAATVEGEPFEAWLHGTGQFRFLRWLATTLPFEIRDTGTIDGLATLYAALPEIDRVELEGNIEVETEDGSQELDFDIVIRDRMGQPLAVARLNASRDPVTETQLAELVKSTATVAEREKTLASAFFVTESYFDPDALATTREATSGSLLSRDKRRSFVKLSRKQGYHLCLVESRDEGFHLSVPDL